MLAIQNAVFLAVQSSGLIAGKDVGITMALQITVVGMLVVFAILAILALCILLISKIGAAAEKHKKVLPKTAEEAASSDATPAASADLTVSAKGSPLPDTESEGALKLVNVDDETAAIIMAIVSNNSGIPLNRLRFNSIKLVEEK